MLGVMLGLATGSVALIEMYTISCEKHFDSKTLIDN